ncbi:VOC family protein [Edaphobacter aggregans]|uniref:VOC family protein n=1 Tax=Edaphobacter aggregans TaxID=570835 RepID=UPI00068AA855|nr:VOC family protein [Edaphobacter aggregans]
MRRVSALLLLLATTAFARSQQQRPAITGIAFVRVYASDPSASANFYGKTLGYSSSRAGDITRYPVNDAQWIEVAPLPSPAPPTRLAAVAFTTRDARALEKYLKAHSVAIVSSFGGDTADKNSFSVHDPEGNLILFAQQAKGPAVPPAVPATAASRRIIHAGFVVRDAAAEDRFYKDILGFRANWHGGRDDSGRVDWSSVQVPEGTDWLEYMLNVSPDATPKQLGGSNHMSLGTAHMNDVVATLQRNQCEGPTCTKTQMGRDGKVQLNLYDPDLTRVEFMEFKPSGTTCCSAILGKLPSEQEDR